MRCGDLSAGENHGWSRWDSQARSPFQRGDRVASPADASIAFGPVKTERRGSDGIVVSIIMIVREKHIAGGECFAAEEEDSGAALGQTESLRVNDAIGPVLAQLLKMVDEPFHCLTSVEMEHERHVLEQYMGWLRFPNQAKDFPDKPRVFPKYPCCLPRLAQILAWKSRCHQGDAFWKGAQITDITFETQLGEPRFQNSCCFWIILTRKNQFMPRTTQPQFKAANSRE